MCIIAVAYQVNSDWPLLAIANRDEFHDRPSAPLSQWEDCPDVIAGRDIEAGGTWLGVTHSGRLAAVSNVRRVEGAPVPDGSRGVLVLDYLNNGLLPTDEAAQLIRPFNLITVGPAGPIFLTNRPRSRRQVLKRGIHVFSNGALNDHWPKTRRLKSALAGRISSSAPLDLTGLFDELAPETAASCSADPIEESIFVLGPTYGTRCSTVLGVDASGAGKIVERSFGPTGEFLGESSGAFAWPTPPC
ncbi:NRDE family protein [Sphingomonas tabacisoli]|uniref:NRDE family protein n=1 Tax=Sphingomonas tabacisoli TaxID=2249466 RepID=A0ABW4I5X9_9SPHN